MPIIAPTDSWTPGDRSLDVAGLSTGAYGSDSLGNDWTNPAGTVFDDANWITSGTKRYLRASDFNVHILDSLVSCYDQEVTTWTRDGVIYLRLTPDGRALYLRLNGDAGTNGSWAVGIITGLTNTAFDEGTKYQIASGTLSGTLGGLGYDKNATENDTFTFGVNGHQIYWKFNATEVARYSYPHHPDRGKIGIAANNTYGFRDLTYSVLSTLALGGNRERLHIDLRDVGLRSLASATGSMSASSSTLTLTSDPGFQVGDTVIVEVGGESGAGVRGTHGVGGTWPALYYATESAMNADTTQADQTWCWVEATGETWIWTAGAPGSWSRPVSFYYWNKALPKALIAAITGINGLDLTLDASAAVATGGASVHLDCSDVFDRLGRQMQYFGEPNYPVVTDTNTWYDWRNIERSMDLIWPAGSFAIGKQLIVTARGATVTVRGAGKTLTELYSPQGAPSATLIEFECAAPQYVRDLHLRGNFRYDGFGLSWGIVSDPNPNVDEVGPVNFEFGLPKGIVYKSFSSAPSEILRCKVTDTASQSFYISLSNDCWVRECDAVCTDGHADYMQWTIQFADSTGGGAEDCTVTSPTLVPGCEPFGCVGTTLRRVDMINGSFSFNCSGDWVLEDCSMLVEAGSQDTVEGLTPFSSLNPMVNINTNNAGGGQNANADLGGTITNMTMEFEGYINADNDLLYGININDNNPDISISGGIYHGVGGFTTSWASPSIYGGPIGVNSTGLNTDVDGMTVEGTPKAGAANIGLSGGGGSSATNCVADEIVVL